jgi:hypothetical protein
MSFKTMLGMPWSGRRHMLFALLVFLPLFFGIYAVKIAPTHRPTGDARYYLAGAYNILEHGTFSSQRVDGEPTPEAHRPPAYSWFLAQGMRFIPALEGADHSWFTGQADTLAPEFVWLKYMQVLLLLGIAMLVAQVVFDLTGRFSYAQWALWIMAFHPVLHRYVQRFYSELFGTFMITCFSTVFYYALKKRNVLLFGLAGLLLGAVTLVFPQWKYIMPVAAVSVALFGLLEKNGRKRLLVGAVLLLVGFQCVVLPWKTRNENLFDREYISGRGGSILLLRAYYDQMPADAYASSFLYWTYGLPKYLLKTFVDEEHYSYLVRDNDGSAIDLTRREKERLAQSVADDAAFDKTLMSVALKRILEHPVRHLLVSIPIGYRSLQDPTFSVFNLVVFFYFVYAFFSCLRGREYVVCCLLAPAAALVCFNALVTHGLPRYTWQLVPIVWTGALYGWFRWCHSGARRKTNHAH